MFQVGLLFCLAGAGDAGAAGAPQELAQLGQRLTPVGAEQAASADGRIPAWQGGLAASAGPVESNGQLGDPFAGEKPLFIITAANYQQYQANLSPGQVALLKRYPDYRLPVYPSHRSVAVADYLKQAVAHNAASTQLIDDGNGVDNYQGAVAFPIPHDGLEVIWNHVTRYRGKSFNVTTDSMAPQVNGDFTVTSTDRRFTLRDQVSDYRPGQNDQVLFYYFQKITAPAREAGEVLLVHETVDQVKEPRQSWIYNAGQRRVRRAPDVAYDAVGPGTSGLRTADNLDMYNGAPDRYEWKLVGKKELFIPYNSYRLASPSLKYKDIIQPGHINQDHTRYELHRVWEVVATLKPGARHIYAKRHFFIDEDSWAIAEVDQYDNRGELWRVGEAHAYFRYDAQVPLNAAEVFYDLQSGRYIASGLINEQRKAYDFSYQASSSDYTPAALRSEGVR
ncbi:DUF1329 domain-containing protein [Pseudomonas sp. CAN2814]|uniref:DUF1329 domain-containing protein n=1 Tax=Pseudomonas sp. CAN1 TaxID=3046726 RepID=UPI002649634C|nr:DUF1329 domain-containing protein [Pseudomonas sp. CAN1]MDN6860238.1 DUF1329 domain-containing protein [Pseudomonas sp. CAN1]